MDIEKTVRNYAKIYRKILSKAKIADIDVEIAAYEKRLKEMYISYNFKRYSIYLSTDAAYVYAIIAMCIGLKSFNMSDSQIIDTINNGFEARRIFPEIAAMHRHDAECISDCTEMEHI